MKVRRVALCVMAVVTLLGFSPLFVHTLVSAGKIGSLSAWGDDQYFQVTDTPSGAFMALADGGFDQSLAIRPDGTLVQWGGVGGTPAVPEIPDEFRDQVFIAATIARSHALALRHDGTIAGWGENLFNRLTPPPGVRFRALAAGAVHSVGIALDGTLHAWGDNSSGQLDVPPGAFSAVASKVKYTIARRRDGTLFGWGHAPGIFSEWTPDGSGHFYAAGKFTDIAAGVDHVLAIRRNNRVVGWGDNTFGQLDPPDGARFKEIAAGAQFSVGILVTQRLVAWGRNDLNQLAVPEGRFETVAVGASHGVAIER